MPHRPLLEKLVALDLNRHVIQWIADYLTSRTQQVVVEGEISKVANVLSGVPQGSVLGPLLFLIYYYRWGRHHLAISWIATSDVC